MVYGFIQKCFVFAESPPLLYAFRVPDMASLLDLIRASTAPPSVMRDAARGKLSIPPAESVELLVHLAGHPELGAEARATLASWQDEELAAICGRTRLPEKVAEFFLQAGARRRPIVTALVNNSTTPESVLVKFAAEAPSEFFPCLLSAARTRKSSAVLVALSSNRVSQTRREQVEQALRELTPQKQSGASASAAVAPAATEGRAPETPQPASNPEGTTPASAGGAQSPEFASAGEPAELADGPSDFEKEHAAEIAAQRQQPFDLTVVSSDERDELAELLPLVKEIPQAVLETKVIDPEKRKQISTLQKIASLTVPERVQLAMRGTREERMILVRDGVKVVALAVLESPKLSETEMESFATMKNVQEVVLRGIALRRRFMKIYGVVRALVSNPRTPLDVSLPLLKTLLLMDLKNLMRNKSVPEMVNRIAAKIFLEKSQTHNR